MASKIKLKRSSIPNKVPQASQLEQGELALNTADGKIFIKKDDGTVVDTTQSIYQRNTNLSVSDNDVTATISATVDGQPKLLITQTGTEFTDPITIAAGQTLKLVDDADANYVAFQAPDNLDYSYVIKLPPNKPVDFSVLASDGADGTVWTNPDTFGGNRVYASDKYGNDDNDGINKPVRTLKRACQIAASLGQRPKVDPGVSAYNAKRLLEDNRAFIQAETIGFIQSNFVNYSGSYDEDKCERDTGLIIDAASYDLALGTNYNAVTAGLAYQRANSSYVLSNQNIQTLGAIDFAKTASAASLISNSTAVSLSNAAFNEVADIITNGSASANTLTFTTPTGASQDLVDAKNQLQQNKSFLKAELTAYINENFIGYQYLDTVRYKCERDINLIINAASYDLALGTNYNAVTAGLAYRRANSAYVLSNQNIQTVTGIEKAKVLSNTALTSDSTAQSRSDSAFDEVLDILLNGEAEADVVTFPTPTGANQNLVDAKDQLQENKDFIAAEIVAFVNDNTPPVGYDSVKCARDVRYIVDALSYDILYGGNTATLKNAEAYFVGLAIAQLGLGQSTATINAYTHLQSVVSDVVQGITITKTTGNTETQDTSSNGLATTAEADQLVSLVKIIKDVIKVGNTTQMPTAVYPSLTWVNSGILTARSNLVNQTSTIVSTTSAYIQSSFSNFTYDQAKCQRDVEYIVDALTYDILYGGNSATITNARAYYVGTTGQLGTNQGTVTLLAYSYLQSLLPSIVEGTEIAETYQSAVTQITSGGSATSAESTELVNLVAIIKGVISAGNIDDLPSTINPSLSWVDGNIITARNQLLADKNDIIADTISFINSEYTGFTYNVNKCSRDVGLIVDAVIYDLILGGNRRSVEAGASYLTVTEVINNQKPETLAAIEFTKELSLSIIKNETHASSYQNLLTQIKYVNLPGTASAADVEDLFDTVIDILDTGVSPTIVEPAFDTIPITVLVAAGDFYIDNPIIIPDKVSIVGDSLRSVVIRPLNANKDMFRVRNGAYLTGITFRDGLDANDVPTYTFNWSVAFDNPSDTSVDRSGYFGLANTKPRITLSPYIQNCSIISFLGGNGIWVDGNLVESINVPLNNIEAENPVNLVDGIPEQGKSMVANAFTMVSFGGTGWFCTNDAYAQIVSCFQIFCLNGSYCQSGGYLSITNSATNFGVYALRSSGYSQNSFEFDRGYVTATGTNGGAITLTTIGTKRVPVNQYVLRIRDADTNADLTGNFKDPSVVQQFNAATDVNVVTNVFTIVDHGFANGDSVIYTSPNNTPILGLLENGVYYISVIDEDTFKLFNDNSLSYPTNILAVGSGTHTLSANVEEFFITETVSSHSAYQELTLASGSYTFEPGQLIAGLTNGFTNNAYVYNYDNVTDKLIVSNEFTLIEGNPQRILFDASSVITSVSGSPTNIAVDSTTTITNTYFTAVSQVSSTKVGNLIQSPTNAIGQKIYFHRPSIVNSSAHTWEFAGAGTDYNALPQNGGVGVASREQYSELPGRVYSSGTNELGDFKVGDFILAENKTGNITFRTRVTVGEIAVLKLSLSNVEVSEFSTDAGLGDNEPNGAQDSRVSTQKAVRSFIANRLGNVIDKDVSSNAVPGAVVQLNSQGQINQDLLPPARGVTTYNVSGWGSRLLLSEQVPSVQVISGDNASESYTQRSFDLDTGITVTKGDIITQDGTTGYGLAKDNYTNETTIFVVNISGTWDTSGELEVNSAASGSTPTTVNDLQNIVDNYYLKKDTSSQFLILDPVNSPYTFVTTTNITGANSGAQGEISSGPVYGVAYTLDVSSLDGGAGYTPASGTIIYYNVDLTSVTGTGSGARADITVTNGEVVAASLVYGGTGYEVGDVLSAATADIGGTSTSAFDIEVSRADTRLYIDLVGTYIKFAATPTSPEYIEDDNADTITIADLSAVYSQNTFDARDISQGGDVNYAQSKITITGHGYTDGDALVYNNGANITIGNFINNKVYWVKPLDNDTIELYNNYGFTSGSKLIFGTSTTGTHSFTLRAVGVDSNTFHIPNHGFTTGQVVRFSAANPPGGLINNGYYYIGSVSAPDGFTFHTNISDAQASVLGVTVGAVSLSSTGSGSATLTIQNVSIIGTVNSSSAIEDNWGQIAQATFDATNIVSGVMSPSRLASTGSANNKTFLRGDSSWEYAVQNIRPAASSPISIVGDFYTQSSTNYYYNSLALDVSKADDGLGNANYTNFGVVALNKIQFTVDSGETTIKSGVIDAGTLGGNSANYFTNPNNLVGNIPVSKGGTNLTTYNKGDLIYSGSNDSLTQLTIGIANSILTSDGLVPSWNTSLTLGGTLTVSGATSLNDATASTSTTTGALKVAGGLGVAGNIYAGGIQNTPIGSLTANTGAFSTLTANSTVSLNGPSATVTISPTGTGIVTISPAGTLTLGTTGVSTALLGNLSATSSNQTVTLSPTGTGTVTIAPTVTTGTIDKMNIGATTRGTGAFTTLTANDATTLTAGTASTSTTSGTLVVTGGVGVSGAINAGSLQNTPIGSTTANSGAFTTLTANGATTLTADTASTSTTSGTLVVTGGVGVSGQVTAEDIVTTTFQANNGVILTDGTNVDQVKAYSKSIFLTTSWQDTGIKNTDLATGSYYMQIYANDNGVGGGHVDVLYSGIISWYAGTTNETTWDEIVLNRSGSSVDQGALFVRLQRSTGSADNLRLQIAGTTINTGAATYIFKFRRLI